MTSSPYQTPTANMETGKMVPCIGCGKSLHFTAASCPNCGASQRLTRYKSKTVAALFAFFLGGFGGHRFYLGQWWGVFYLLFFWAWIPGLIALVECFVFLLSDSRKWDEKYNESKPAGPNEKSGGAVVVILAIFGVFVFIAILGILAAVAIPAYQDYTIRANVHNAESQVAPVRGKVEVYIDENGEFPISNSMIGINDPYVLDGGHQLTLSQSGIILRLASEVDAVNNETIIYTMVQDGEYWRWSCEEGTLPTKYRSSQCRGN